MCDHGFDYVLKEDVTALQKEIVYQSITTVTEFYYND